MGDIAMFIILAFVFFIIVIMPFVMTFGDPIIQYWMDSMEDHFARKRKLRDEELSWRELNI